MVFITRCLRSCLRLESLFLSGFKRGLLLRACVIALLFFGMTLRAHADTPVAVQALKFERQDGALYMTAEWQFEISAALEEALQKGITLYFVTEVDVRQERWYFYNQRVARAERHVRVFYQPLTRRWRVNVSPQPFNASGLGMSLAQSYDSLNDVMQVVRRITPWRIANMSDVSMDAKPSVSINFKLDLKQLPRPLQIGTSGHSDWNLEFNRTQRLELAP